MGQRKRAVAEAWAAYQEAVQADYAAERRLFALAEINSELRCALLDADAAEGTALVARDAFIRALLTRWLPKHAEAIAAVLDPQRARWADEFEETGD